MPAISPQILARLRRYDTPTICNLVELFDVRPRNTGYMDSRIQACFPDLPPMVGFAVTVTIRSETPFPDADAKANAMLPLYAAVAAVDGPKVVVVQDLDQGAGCLWGEVNATICSAMGCEGVVTDGLVRDLSDVEALGFRLLARGVGVARAWVAIEATGVPVTVGGTRFTPGDVVHADRHGALVIPAAAVAALPAAADAVMDRERRLLDWVRSDAFDPNEIAARRAQH